MCARLKWSKPNFILNTKSFKANMNHEWMNYEDGAHKNKIQQNDASIMCACQAATDVGERVWRKASNNYLLSHYYSLQLMSWWGGGAISMLFADILWHKKRLIKMKEKNTRTNMHMHSMWLLIYKSKNEMGNWYIKFYTNEVLAAHPTSSRRLRNC